MHKCHNAKEDQVMSEKMSLSKDTLIRFKRGVNADQQNLLELSKKEYKQELVLSIKDFDTDTGCKKILSMGNI